MSATGEAVKERWWLWWWQRRDGGSGILRFPLQRTRPTELNRLLETLPSSWSSTSRGPVYRSKPSSWTNKAANEETGERDELPIFPSEGMSQVQARISEIAHLMSDFHVSTPTTIATRIARPSSVSLGNDFDYITQSDDVVHEARSTGWPPNEYGKMQRHGHNLADEETLSSLSSPRELLLLLLLAVRCKKCFCPSLSRWSPPSR